MKVGKETPKGTITEPGRILEKDGRLMVMVAIGERARISARDGNLMATGEFREQVRISGGDTNRIARGIYMVQGEISAKVGKEIPMEASTALERISGRAGNTAGIDVTYRKDKAFDINPPLLKCYLLGIPYEDDFRGPP